MRVKLSRIVATFWALKLVNTKYRVNLTRVEAREYCSAHTISSGKEVEHHPTRIQRRYLRILGLEGCSFFSSFASLRHATRVSLSNNVRILASCGGRFTASDAFDVSKNRSEKPDLPSRVDLEFAFIRWYNSRIEGSDCDILGTLAPKCRENLPLNTSRPRDNRDNNLGFRMYAQIFRLIKY